LELLGRGRRLPVHAMNNREILLDPIDMTEELMFHMFNNDMNRELDGRWLDLYLSLQLYKEHLERIERDEDS
jgi:hypothetical protein